MSIKAAYAFNCACNTHIFSLIDSLLVPAGLLAMTGEGLTCEVGVMSMALSRVEDIELNTSSSRPVLFGLFDEFRDVDINFDNELRLRQNLNSSVATCHHHFCNCLVDQSQLFPGIGWFS